MTSDIKHTLDVLSAIMRHRSNSPIKGEDVHKLTGIDPRSVAFIASEAQKRGFPICSSVCGYFLGTTAEWQAHIAKEEHRAAELHRKVSAAKANHIGQITLFEQPKMAQS